MNFIFFATDDLRQIYVDINHHICRYGKDPSRFFSSMIIYAVFSTFSKTNFALIVRSQFTFRTSSL